MNEEVTQAKPDDLLADYEVTATDDYGQWSLSMWCKRCETDFFETCTNPALSDLVAAGREHDCPRPTVSFEGTVLARAKCEFTSEVIDLDTDERAIATFRLTVVRPADYSRCQPGALFYWRIYADGRSLVRFR